MSEQISKLRETLAELEAELANVDALDDDSRERLASVAAEISHALARSEPAPSSPHSLHEQMVDTIETFEATNPTIAGILQRLVNGLAQIGV